MSALGYKLIVGTLFIDAHPVVTPISYNNLEIPCIPVVKTRSMPYGEL